MADSASRKTQNVGDVITVAGQNSVSPGQTMQLNNQGGNAMQPVMNTSQPQPMKQKAQSMTAVASQRPHIGTNQHQSLQPQQMQQVLSDINIHNQQPQQIQHQQGASIQTHHQTQTVTNIITPQQYQQPQIQQIHHQLGNLQSDQHSSQSMMQPPQQKQQQTIPQHIPKQTVQHQQQKPLIPVQKQINQGQMPVQVPQYVMQIQVNIQQMPQQSAQMQDHEQMQPGASQHMQHVPVQQMSLGGVVGTTAQVIQTQNAQQQQDHLPTSQPMMQPRIQSQPNLMSVQQLQYYTNPQMQNTNMVLTNPNQVIQTQDQSNPNFAIQQNYPVNIMNQQQQPQQIPMGHTMQPANIPYLSQSQMTTSNITSATQNSVISPQPAFQGTWMPLVQQYISQQLTSSIAPSQASGGIQTYPSSAVNTVPSVMENVVKVSAVEASTEQSVKQQVETLGDGAGLLEADQQAEDAENAPGASAVAIDNKIQQAMDLVKSHLIFAVREELEVLKVKIAKLMDRTKQLEMENKVLKASATQETLAQLSSFPPASGGDGGAS